MSPVLLDSDVLIDHLRGYRRLPLAEPGLKISIVTRCELFAGRHADEPALRQTLDMFEELPLDRTIAETAGRIRRASGIPVPDALIAATAMQRQLPLMTRNLRHFERVAGIALRAPADLAEAAPTASRRRPS